MQSVLDETLFAHVRLDPLGLREIAQLTDVRLDHREALGDEVCVRHVALRSIRR